MFQIFKKFSSNFQVIYNFGSPLDLQLQAAIKDMALTLTQEQSPWTQHKVLKPLTYLRPTFPSYGNQCCVANQPAGFCMTGIWFQLLSVYWSLLTGLKI